MTTRKSLLRRLLTRAIPAALVLLVLPYVWAPLYHFPDPAPFSGSDWLNPYAGVTAGWKRANLHAHGRAWSGLTNGAQPDDPYKRPRPHIRHDHSP